MRLSARRGHEEIEGNATGKERKVLSRDDRKTHRKYIMGEFPGYLDTPNFGYLF